MDLIRSREISSVDCSRGLTIGKTSLSNTTLISSVMITTSWIISANRGPSEKGFDTEATSISIYVEATTVQMACAAAHVGRPSTVCSNTSANAIFIFCISAFITVAYHNGSFPTFFLQWIYSV